MSRGPDLVVLRRRSAGDVDRILGGEDPGDLPIQQPSALNLVVNLSTAEAFGVTIPPKIMIQATELIE